jgi:hypothetical protein
MPSFTAELRSQNAVTNSGASSIPRFSIQDQNVHVVVLNALMRVRVVAKSRARAVNLVRCDDAPTRFADQHTSVRLPLGDRPPLAAAKSG